MTDTVGAQKRSWVMRQVRGRGNQSTEAAFAGLLRQSKMTGWRRHCPLPGKPDFVFYKARLAVFVDGCFWHGCPTHCRMPKSNRRYWRQKIDGNRRRDKKTARHMRKNGWHVFRVWEHEIKQKQTGQKLGRMRRLLAAANGAGKANMVDSRQ